MITVRVFARYSTSTLKQAADVTVKGITKTVYDGMAGFDLPAPGTYNVIVKSAGFVTWQGDLTFGQYANVMDVSLEVEVPPAAGYQGYCTVSAYASSMGTLWRYSHPDLGSLNEGYTSSGDAAYSAHLDDRCFKHFPPPLTEEEEITRDVMQQVQGQIETALANALDPINAAIAGIPAQISNAIALALDPILASISALTGQISKEVSDRIKAISDLDASLKAWITDKVFELLLSKLDEGARDVSSK